MNRKGDRSKKGIRKNQTGDPERKKNQYYPRCGIRPVLKKNKSWAKKKRKEKRGTTKDSSDPLGRERAVGLGSAR